MEMALFNPVMRDAFAKEPFRLYSLMVDPSPEVIKIWAWADSRESRPSRAVRRLPNQKRGGVGFHKVPWAEGLRGKKPG